MCDCIDTGVDNAVTRLSPCLIISHDSEMALVQRHGKYQGVKIMHPFPFFFFLHAQNQICILQWDKGWWEKLTKWKKQHWLNIKASIILSHFEKRHKSMSDLWLSLSLYICYLMSFCHVGSIISEIPCLTHLYGRMMRDYANCKAESHSVWDLNYT